MALNNKLLKEIKIKISFPLAHIFNWSLSTGTFHEALKRSRIVAVHQQGDTDNYSNKVKYSNQ
jgi:hypothetical protein